MQQDKFSIGSISPASEEVNKTKRNYKFWHLNVEVVLLCVSIFGVWSLLSLPVIFYHIPISEPSNSSNRTSVSVCSAPLQYGTTSDTCLSEFTTILTSSNCLLNPEGIVLVVRNEDATVTQLINGLKSIGGSAECLSKAAPFLCLHLFGLCGGSEVSIQPTTSQCEEIRDTLCQQQWIHVEGLGIDLPDCAIFPAEASSCPALNYSETTNETIIRNTSEKYPSFPNGTVLKCADGFYRENSSSICTPSCYTWTQNNKGLSIFFDVALFISAFIGFVAAIAVIIISCLKHKRMLIFPSIFIVYMVTDVMALAGFVMVNYMDRNKICSSRSLIESLRQVTPFCVISGILLTYVLFQLALWWLLHTVTFFWKVTFPFHARSFEISGKIKYIHITCIVIGILLPLVPIITSMADYAVDIRKQNNNSTSHQRNNLFLSGGLGFTVSRFPPILCIGKDSDAVFYSLVIMIDIVLASGCTLLIIIISFVHKQNVKFKIEKPKHQFTFGTAEKKLLIVFCYYVVTSVTALTALTFSTRNASQWVVNIQKYFFCEQGGHNPSSPCSRSHLEEITSPTISILSFILLSLFPVVNLLYAVNIQELKELWRKCLTKKHIITTNPCTRHAGESA